MQFTLLSLFYHLLIATYIYVAIFGTVYVQSNKIGSTTQPCITTRHVGRRLKTYVCGY